MQPYGMDPMVPCCKGPLFHAAGFLLSSALVGCWHPALPVLRGAWASDDERCLLHRLGFLADIWPPHPARCAGMVAETGEATARFLRSIAEGEIDQRTEIERQAALGRERVRSMRLPDLDSGRPHEGYFAASHELVRSGLQGFNTCWVVGYKGIWRVELRLAQGMRSMRLPRAWTRGAPTRATPPPRTSWCVRGFSGFYLLGLWGIRVLGGLSFAWLRACAPCACPTLTRGARAALPRCTSWCVGGGRGNYLVGCRVFVGSCIIGLRACAPCACPTLTADACTRATLLRRTSLCAAGGRGV